MKDLYPPRNMEYLFVTYNVANKLKKLGFNAPCFSAYRNTDGEKELMGISKWVNYGWENTHDGYCAAPTYLQVVDWLVWKYGIFVSVHYDSIIKKGKYCFLIHMYGDLKHNESIKSHGYKTPHQAWPNAMKAALKLIQ